MVSLPTRPFLWYLCRGPFGLTADSSSAPEPSPRRGARPIPRPSEVGEITPTRTGVGRRYLLISSANVKVTETRREKMTTNGHYQKLTLLARNRNGRTKNNN